VEEISIGDAEVYSEHMPLQTEPSAHLEVKVITQTGGDVSGLVGGNLADEQLKDKEIGAVVAMRLSNESPPRSDDIQTESELTKKLLLQWDDLIVKDGVIYRKKVKEKRVDRTSKEPEVNAGPIEIFQLLLPRSEVTKAIELCHAGSVGGHFGIQKTMAQVERRFFWPEWRSNVKRYCKSCSECTR